MQLRVYNNFHGRAVRLRANGNTVDGYHLSRRQVLRARKTLCGITGCCCGDHIGQRDTVNNRWHLDPQSDGSVHMMLPIGAIIVSR